MAHHWVHKPFAELSLGELYAVMALRQEVFVVEQRCPYLDLDGLDARATHLFCVAQDADKEAQPTAAPPYLIAYARLFAPGARTPEAAIGRVVTSPTRRRVGLGRELMRRAIEAIEHQYGRTPIRLGAQKYLERFYLSLGFVRDGNDYLEDDIVHLPMRRG